MRAMWKTIRNHITLVHVLLLVILLVGAALRLYRIGEYMTFLGDEGRDMLVVKRMIVDGKFTLLGPTASVGGFFMGPAYYYLMAPFLWLWRLDPTGPAVMVALFGIATIYLVYRVTTDMVTRGAGLVAASLYAISPITIAYSRSSWNPNLVPFFSLMFFYLLWRYVTRKERWNVFWAGVVAGIGLQHHYVFTFLLPVAAVYMLMHADIRKHIIDYGRGAVGFVVGFSPFLLFELRHGFPNTQAIWKFLLHGDETGLVAGTFFSNISMVVFRIFGRLVFRFPEESTFFAYTEPMIQMWQWGVWAAIIGCVGMLILTLLHMKKKIRLKPLEVLAKHRYAWPTVSLLLLWLTGVVVMFGFYQRGIYDYYFGIAFALPFILFAALLSVLWQHRYLRVAAVVIVAVVLYINALGAPFRFAPNNQLGQTRRIAHEALDKTGGEPFNFALVTATNSDHAYRYFFEIWGRPPVTIENEVVDPQRDTVTDQLIVICENPTCEVLGHPLWEIAGFGRAEITGTWEVPFVKIIRLVHTDAEEEHEER